MLNGRSVLILGWLGSGGPPESFAFSYLRLPVEEKPNAAVRLALEHSENTYIRPSWWNNLPETDQDSVTTRFSTLEAPPVFFSAAQTGFAMTARSLSQPL